MELSSDMDSFTHLLADETPPQTVATKSVRNKRGLLNVLGYGLKYLFGTADAKDVLRLRFVLNFMHLRRKLCIPLSNN